MRLPLTSPAPSVQPLETVPPIVKLLHVVVVSLLGMCLGTSVLWATEVCRRIYQPDAPQWFSGAIWNEGTGELLYVDVWKNRLTAYDVDTNSTRHIESIDGAPSFYPSLMRPAAEGFLLENTNGHIIHLDWNYTVQEEWNLVGVKNASGQTIDALWDFSDNGSHLVAFVDLKDESGDPPSAFLSIPKDNTSGFELLRSVNSTHPNRKIYLVVGHQYFSRAGKSAYYADILDRIKILELPDDFDLSKKRSFFLDEALPGFGTVPQIQWKSLDFAAKYRRLEDTPLLVGVYGGKDILFSLTRSAARSSDNIWRLTSIAGREGGDTIRHSIKSPAKVLLVAPGIHQWAFLEIDSIRVPGDLKLLSILLVPTGWIETPEEGFVLSTDTCQ